VRVAQIPPNARKEFDLATSACKPTTARQPGALPKAIDLYPNYAELSAMGVVNLETASCDADPN